MLEKRAYASRISDLGENIIRPQNALNVYHLTAHAYWLVLKKAIHGVFSCKTVSPQDSSCYPSKQRRLGAKCNSLLTGNVTSEIAKDNLEWGCVTLTLFGLVPSSTSYVVIVPVLEGVSCIRELPVCTSKMKGIGIEIMKVLVNLIVFYYPYDKTLMSWTKQLVEYMCDLLSSC